MTEDDKRHAEQREHLIDGRTLSGASITLDRTDVQNYARLAVSSVSHNLMSIALPGDDDERYSAVLQLTKIADVLRANISNPAHYEGETPGLTNYAGTPLVPDAQFSYADLFGFGVTGEDGIAGFRRDAGLQPDTDARHIVAAAGLLECDLAVRCLDDGDPYRAAYHIGETNECRDLLLSFYIGGGGGSPSDEQIQDALAHKWREHSSKGGKRAAEVRRATAKLPPQVAIKERAKLLTQGREEWEVAGIIAAKFGVSPKHVRTTLKAAQDQ